MKLKQQAIMEKKHYQIKVPTLSFFNRFKCFNEFILVVIKKGESKLTEILLDNHINKIDNQNENGRTPLMTGNLTKSTK